MKIKQGEAMKLCKIILIAIAFSFVAGCGLLKNKPKIDVPNETPGTLPDQNPNQKPKAPKAPTKTKKKIICIDRIDFYTDESFSKPVEESSTTAKIKTMATSLLKSKLISLGFESGNCDLLKKKNYYLDVGSYHSKESLLKHSINSRVRVFKKPVNDKLNGLLFEIFVESDIKGKDDSEIFETVTDSVNKIVDDLVKKIKP